MTAHRYRLSPRFYELDPYGHVNHTAYLQYFETARVELLREVGFDLVEMERAGVMIVVVDLQVRFVTPATLGDELVIETEVVETRRVSTRWRQRMLRGEELIAAQELSAAMTNRDGRPTRFDPKLVEALERFTIG